MEDIAGKPAPLVSISCITFNHAGYIRDALEGFLMQKTSFPFEILINDDASTDGTADIIHEYENRYPDLIFPIYQAENQFSKGLRGLSSRFNVPRARGKYIAICEGDDYWIDPLKLQKQVDFLEANPEYNMCWTRFKILEEDTGNLTIDKNEKYFEGNEDRVEFDLEKFYKGWHIGMQTVVFKKEIYNTGYFTRYKTARDIHLVTELLMNGKGACLNFFGAVYRQHEGGIYTPVSKLEKSKSGYLSYREIYLHFKNEKFLKLKYISFGKAYADHLLEAGRLDEGLKIAYELSKVEGNADYFFKILKAAARRFFS